MSDKTGTLFIISAPSGTGKTTLVRKICEMMDNLVVSISFTTRPKRNNEVHGIDYFFVSEDEFNRMIANNDFLEYATVFEYLYGTSKLWVGQQLDMGNDVILEIDWQGAQNIRKKMKNVSIFILPPTFASLEKRLRNRGTDDEATIMRRCREAFIELSQYPDFDYLIKNDDLDIAIGDLKQIIQSVRDEKPVNTKDLSLFASELMTEGANLQ